MIIFLFFIISYLSGLDQISGLFYLSSATYYVSSTLHLQFLLCISISPVFQSYSLGLKNFPFKYFNKFSFPRTIVFLFKIFLRSFSQNQFSTALIKTLPLKVKKYFSNTSKYQTSTSTKSHYHFISDNFIILII